MAETSPGIGGAADRIRETAKWLTVSLAALGGVLIAGSQLSDIGGLQPSSSRFIVALCGGGIAAVAAVTILAFAIWVATTPAVSLKNLATNPPAGLADTLSDPRFLDGRNSVIELDGAYTAALNTRNVAFATLRQQDTGANRVAAAAADAEVVSLSDTVTSLLAVVTYMRLAYRWRRAGAALSISPRPGDPDSVILARHRRKITDDDRDLVRIATATQIRKNAFGGIRGVDPGEALGIAVETIERRRGAIEEVEIAHQPSHSFVEGIGKELPVEPDIMIPFALLSELPAHEQQFLAGMSPHED